jgi:O-methyltransferase involved in polyketide biosynthesis
MVEFDTNQISGTAFVVNYSRSRMIDISSDIYADFWVTPESVSLWNDFAQEVYPYDDLNISLRNRFYLEHIQSFITKNTHPVCVNLGAGFTNYPFLTDGPCRFIEVDYPHVVAYKDHAVSFWIKEGNLPSRNITYLPADLNSKEDLEILQGRLQAEIDSKPSVVILEGVTYYLEPNQLMEIFRILHDIQISGSIILFDYWTPDAMEYPVMMRLKKFMDEHFGYQDKSYNLFDLSFIQKIEGYIIIESTDSAHLENTYATSTKFQENDQKLPVLYAVLLRT